MKLSRLCDHRRRGWIVGPGVRADRERSANCDQSASESAPSRTRRPTTPVTGWYRDSSERTSAAAGTRSVDLSTIEDLDTNNSTSVNFGGQVAYLGRGVIGGEFLADFSPGLGTFNNVLFEQSPNVNSYMFNLIAVAPFGHAHSYDPYISGGIGAVTLNSTIFTIDPTRGSRTSTSHRNRDGQRVEIRMGPRRRSHGVVRKELGLPRRRAVLHDQQQQH